MSMLARSIVGSPDAVRSGIDALVAETGADELMIVSVESRSQRTIVEREYPQNRPTYKGETRS
jgi:alkanesulfonate monooxygenase SsuD/methylene tetrahydromethanopterin reductase-like flavin-dependent oxidoreductase (luciferase family)